MNRIKYKHFINSVMQQAYGHRWKNIKRKLKKITVITIADQAKIGEDNTSYLEHAMMKHRTIVELTNNGEFTFYAPNIIRSLYGH